MFARCPLARRDPRMSTRAVTPAKPAGAQSALCKGHSCGPDVPEGPGTSVALGWASRIRCDESLPDVVDNTIARGGPNLCQCMPSMDRLVVRYRTPIRAALGRTKEQVCTASAPMALGAAVTGGVSDRKDMLSCLYRKAVGWQNPH